MWYEKLSIRVHLLGSWNTHLWCSEANATHAGKCSQPRVTSVLPSGQITFKFETKTFKEQSQLPGNPVFHSVTSDWQGNGMGTSSNPCFTCYHQHSEAFLSSLRCAVAWREVGSETPVYRTGAGQSMLICQQMLSAHEWRNKHDKIIANV